VHAGPAPGGGTRERACGRAIVAPAAEFGLLGGEARELALALEGLAGRRVERHSVRVRNESERESGGESESRGSGPRRHRHHSHSIVAGGLEEKS
jgi:hypothetical protein